MDDYSTFADEKLVIKRFQGYWYLGTARRVKVAFGSAENFGFSAGHLRAGELARAALDQHGVAEVRAVVGPEQRDLPEVRQLLHERHHGLVVDVLAAAQLHLARVGELLLGPTAHAGKTRHRSDAPLLPAMDLSAGTQNV